MKAKKKTKKALVKQTHSTIKMMFLSFILLFIIFEALYVLKGQQKYQTNSLRVQVAGVHTQR